jgi:hypothetical protein
MLRRLNQAVRLEHDLVLVHESPALVEVGQSVDVGGESWRVAHVTGELTLRDALPEADRLIAIVPTTFPPPPMDIAARTYLNRIIEVRAEDLVAAMAGRFCEALIDENLTKAVFDSVETLRTTTGAWTFGANLVTAREVRSVIVGAELGASRLNREHDWVLLARWILDGAPTFRAPTLVRDALVEAQPRAGAWLGWALTEGSIEQLCTAGALLASSEGVKAAPVIPGLAEADRSQLVELVDSALREVWRIRPSRATQVLAEAEKVARRVDLDASLHRLLRVPLEGALNAAASRSAKGDPPDDVAIEGLKRNLHAPALAESIEVVGDLARLARFQRLEAPASDASPAAWLRLARNDVAWADLAHRRVRRSLASVPAWLGDLARPILTDWVARRDALNAAFAQSLSTRWPSVAANADTREPLALHQITRCLVRRLVDDGSRVFLVVLDGCDVASFLEILDSLPPEQRIGLALPEVRDAVLRDDLSAMGAFGVAVSPLPTVTSHSRRALFAGEIAGNVALVDTESAAANATGDARAWTNNTALGTLPRRLFLKGELGTSGQPLLDVLRGADLRVVAAVFNGVDDALSSKETTPIPTWSLAALGAGAAEAVRLAIAEGWCVLVTADHGHTPFLSADRKVDGESLGQRFGTQAAEGSVMFNSGPLPRKPLHLLTRFGSWFGQQHRGFHGGASLEEVVVPLAFLGSVRGEQEGRARAPAWWWSAEGVSSSVGSRDPGPREAPRAAPKSDAPKPAAPPPQPKVDARLESLTLDEKLVIALLQQNQSARLSVIAVHVKKSPMRASGFMQQLMRKLFELGVPCVTVEVLPDNDRLYRYQQPADRGNR